MQIILLGSGISIKEGIYNGLWERIKDSFSIGINYSFRYSSSTALCCMNYTDFYDVNREELKELPLIITCERPHPSAWEDNTVLVKNKNYALSGILALDIATMMLGKGDEIFLLGFDYGAINETKDSQGRNMTHFYQDQIEHRGIGENGYYTHIRHAYKDFDRFIFSKCSIFNVSMDSRLDCFGKISYDTFFKKLDNKTYNQDNLRAKIKDKITHIA